MSFELEGGFSSKPKSKSKSKNPLKSLKKAAKGMADKAKSASKGMADKAKSASKGMVDKAKSASKGMADKAKSASKGMADKAQDQNASAAPLESQSAAPLESQSATPVESQSAAPVESQSATPVESQSATPVESQSAAPVEPPSWPFPYKTPIEETGIDLTQGPDIETIHDSMNRMSIQDLLTVPPEIQKEIDSYINERIISPAEANEYNASSFMNSVLTMYRYVTKFYLSLDYIVNYRAEAFMENKIDSVPGLIRDLVSKNKVFLLLFLEPNFLGNVFIFIILSIVLHNTILPNTQQYGYSDIPKSMWYVPVYVTRFLGNVFFFLFYLIIVFWAGMRKLSNDNVSTPITLSYILMILLFVQVIFMSYVGSVSGKIPETGLKDSVSVVLSTMIPLLIISFSPNFVNLIPSGFVRRHKDIPILPESPAPKGLKYSMDFSTIGCYTSGRFWQNSFLFILMYVFLTFAFTPLDPTLTTFVRSDKENLKHRDDLKQPAIFNQSFVQKGGLALVYHAVVALVIIISSVSITGMPKPYNNSTQMFNSALLFSFLLPLGKLLIDFKYRADDGTMDFYGSFWDYFGTIFRIMIPISILTYLNRINSIISFILYFDSNKPIPKWLLYLTIILLFLAFALIMRSITPHKKEDDKKKIEEFLNINNNNHTMFEQAESNTRTLLEKAKKLFQSFKQ